MWGSLVLLDHLCFHVRMFLVNNFIVVHIPVFKVIDWLMTSILVMSFYD